MHAEPDRSVRIDHPSNDHYFLLTIELTQEGASTLVSWQQTFKSVEQYRQVADFVAQASAQVLARLAAEVLTPRGADE